MQNLQAIWPHICQDLCASDIYRLKTISIVSQKRVSTRSSLDLLWISSQGFDLSIGGIFKRDMPRCRANIFNNVGNIRRPWPNWVQYLGQHKEYLNQNWEWSTSVEETTWVHWSYPKHRVCIQDQYKAPLTLSLYTISAPQWITRKQGNLTIIYSTTQVIKLSLLRPYFKFSEIGLVLKP